MTEPKYKVGDWVELHTGVIVRIERLQACRDGQAYWCNDIESFHAEEEIKHAVKIIPITDEPFCKDCKNFPEIGKEGYFAAYWSERKCPLTAWASQAVTPYGSRLNHSRTQVGNDNYDIETLQPPDNCYCFEPKEEAK